MSDKSKLKLLEEIRSGSWKPSIAEAEVSPFIETFAEPKEDVDELIYEVLKLIKRKLEEY